MRPYITAVAAGLALLAGLAGGAARSAGQTPGLPELDLVVRTAIRVTPEHTQAYAAHLQTAVEQCFGGLVEPGAAPGTSPKDGAARYRLYVEHAGTVVVSPSPVSETLQTDKDFYAKFLVSQEKGALRFTLKQWTGSKYVNVEAWSANLADKHYMGLEPHITSKEMEGLRQTALMQTMPESAGQGVLDHLLPIRVVKVGASAGMTRDVTVGIQNRSPWPLVRLAARLDWPDERSVNKYRYLAEVAWTGLLMPGEQTTANSKASAKRTEYKWQFVEPLRLAAAPVFDATRGPEWVRRAIEDVKGQDAAAKQAAIAALEGLAANMQTAESAAAIAGFIDLMAHDAPKSEADLSPDALRFLQRMGEKAIPALADALRSPNAGIRLGAACLLGKTSVTDKAVLARLRDVTRDKCEAVAQAAAKALEANGAAPAAP